MTGRRGTAVAIALLGAALATAGCGLGPGDEVGDVELTVTREFGAERTVNILLPAKESDTVMRALEGQAEVQTRYGGGFVHSIDGVAEGERGGDPYDWFFYVNGEESPIGAAEYELEGGEKVWWDYRDWSATNHVPAVVGSWPAPFIDGLGHQENPVVVECLGPGVEPMCGEARRTLEIQGVKVATGEPEKAIRVLVGTWDQVRRDPTAALIEDGPAASGVYASFEGGDLVALDEDGEPAGDLGPGAGLVAATSRYGGLPVWVLTGGTPAAVRLAASALHPDLLGDHYAIAIKDLLVRPLPLREP